jgi:glyoxylase-like metal-dependent hydrolase (beta-lactamase superfamily II)
MKTLTFSLFVSLLLYCSCQQKERVPDSDNFNLVKLADGVYACINKTGGKAICNAGIVDLGDASLVFDPFLSPRVAEELHQTIHALGLPPVKYVVNSHYHNDHIRGNQVFPEDAQIISTTKTAQLIAEKEPQELAAEEGYAPKQLAFFDSLQQNFRGDTLSRDYQSIKMWRAYFEVLTESIGNIKTRVPTSFVDAKKIIEGPERQVTLLTFGKGHTESDLVMYLPDGKILFSGDIVFDGMHPYMPDGFPGAWMNYLDSLQKLEVNQLVPGHGDVTSAMALKQMKNYIGMVEAKAQELVDAGLQESAVDTVTIPAPFDTWWFDRFFFINMHFMYGQLSGNNAGKD